MFTSDRLGLYRDEGFEVTVFLSTPQKVGELEHSEHPVINRNQVKSRVEIQSTPRKFLRAHEVRYLKAFFAIVSSLLMVDEYDDFSRSPSYISSFLMITDTVAWDSVHLTRIYLNIA